MKNKPNNGETLNIAPTWTGAAQIILLVLEAGTEDARKVARAELLKMARIADTAAKLYEDADEVKQMIIENYIDHFSSNETERDQMKNNAFEYVQEDHAQEIQMRFDTQHPPIDFHIVTLNP